MTKVLCTMRDCKYCGRKSAKYQLKNGDPVYTCKRESITIVEPLDWDDEYFENRGHKEASCNYYETKGDTIIWQD